MGATEWRLPNGTFCGDSVISLSQIGSCSDVDDTCGPFSAANDGSDGTSCLVSSLTVTTSTNLNNTLIQCSNVDLMSNPTEVGSAVLTIAGLCHIPNSKWTRVCQALSFSTAPPPPPTGVSVANCTGDSVTLVWEEPIDTDSPVTSYELLATPTVENCPLNNCSAPSTQYSLTGLDRGRQYAVSVRADACDGALEGTFSSPLSFTLDGNFDY